jgi:transcription antitermination factor NusB
MKTAQDPRHQRRSALVQELFTYSFGQPVTDKTSPLIEKLPEIDAMIAKAAPAWPTSQMNRVDLAILRVAVFELLTSDVPHRVMMDEAIELAKEYGAEQSAKFVNGVLAHLVEKGIIQTGQVKKA